MTGWRLIEADCIEAMAAMDEASVDAIVTDPPYGLEFMGKEWDRLATIREASDGYREPGSRAATSPMETWGSRPTAYVAGRTAQDWHHRWATAALRVLKPGGHLLAFGGTRTYHRLVCAIEDAGFEVRDCLAWMYGSGFPKSLDVSKAIDKAAGAEREVVGEREVWGRGVERFPDIGRDVPVYGNAKVAVTAPATDAARTWQGWGTALKPAFEPIVLARKPLSEPNVAANVQRWGTGALNIDGTRIGTDDDLNGGGYDDPDGTSQKNLADASSYAMAAIPREFEQPAGRWPANVVLDEEAGVMLDEQTGERPGAVSNGSKGTTGTHGIYNEGWGVQEQRSGYGDTGGASRFFYCPKADREERDRGLEHRALQPLHWSSGDQSPGTFQAEGTLKAARNPHPTVKPVELMRWLCRLVTPPGGVVLDPFTGSGSTGIAALREGFSFIGIEREPEYVAIARDRIIGDAPLLNTFAEVSP